MPSNRYPILARESWPILLIILILLIAAKVQFDFIGYTLIAFIFIPVLFLFRDPHRHVPSEPLGIVSPVHGVVTLIEDDSKDVRLKRTAKRVQIRVRLYDIYSIRSPIEGKISEQWSSAPDALESKCHFDFWIKTDEGDDIVVAVRLRRFVHRCRMYLHSGERVGHGQRCGYIYFGGIIDVFIPVNSRIEVKTGDTLLSGSTVIGHLIHPEVVSAIET